VPFPTADHAVPIDNSSVISSEADRETIRVVEKLEVLSGRLSPLPKSRPKPRDLAAGLMEDLQSQGIESRYFHDLNQLCDG
jgi:hypothetical protein